MEVCCQSLQPEFQHYKEMRNIINRLLFSAGIVSLLTACGVTDSTNQDNSKETTMQTNQFNNATPEQLDGIKTTLNAYIDAAVKGDSKIAEPLFTENATISHIEDDTLISLPIQALFDYYNSDVCPQPASYEITVCNVSNDVAIVAIDSDFGGTKFDDMFTMVKDGNVWKIVSKVFHVK